MAPLAAATVTPVQDAYTSASFDLGTNEEMSYVAGAKEIERRGREHQERRFGAADHE